MNKYYASDGHKRYSVFGSIDEKGQKGPIVRVEHERDDYKVFLRSLPERSVIALESIGNWYWQVDAMEAAGHIPILVNARKAKLMMGQINKTDKLDVYGLATMNRNGTLPGVWIAPGELRDQRELPRMRMAMVSVRTKFKNRIHATLAKYNIVIEEVSDIFGKEGRRLLEEDIQQLPRETKSCVQEQLKLLDETQERIKVVEARIKEVIRTTEVMKHLDTLPGFGPILSIVVALEMGCVERFVQAESFASYSGVVPRIHSSGGKTYYGKTSPMVNHYLKGAFIEAANVIMMNRKRWPQKHVVKLYEKISTRRGHAKAIVAVGRHLAEAAYWMTQKMEPYREPQGKLVSSNQS